jgi:Zn-dependent M28 family amino/carboxypeptidase
VKRVSRLLAGTFLLASTLAAGRSSVGRAETPEVRRAAGKITEEVLRAHTKFLASDLLEGRGPATRGDSLAEVYIQSQMEAMGLKPGAPGGGWIQKVPLVGVRASFSAPAVFRSERGSAEGVPGNNFVAFSGVQKPTTKIENAEIVFVGYGIVAPEYQWDDYKDTDLSGKVLLMMNNDPENDPNLFAGKTRLWYGRWDYKYLMAAKKGAAGAILIHTTPSAGYPWHVVKNSWAGENFELPDDGSPRVQIKMWATEELSGAVAKLAGKDLDSLRASAESRSFRPVPLGVQFSFAMANAIVQKESGNVVGRIPGGDPKLSGEAVVYTAHHDHFGIKAGTRPEDDAIYNGAIDNASGVASILSVARAFADLRRPPRRSVYFAFVAGEEQGLLGSQYFAMHPPVPMGRIAANINIDEANWFGRTRDISLIGLGKSSLDRDVIAVAKTQGRAVKPDEFPDRGRFYRSDQFNFAKAGVPAAYLKFGTDVIGKPARYGKEQVEAYEKNTYHQPSDEYRDSLDFSGAVQDARLAFLLGLRVANADAMPHWNAGDEFEAARKRALAEIKPR